MKNMSGSVFVIENNVVFYHMVYSILLVLTQPLSYTRYQPEIIRPVNGFRNPPRQFQITGDFLHNCFEDFNCEWDQINGEATDYVLLM